MLIYHYILLNYFLNWNKSFDLVKMKSYHYSSASPASDSVIISRCEEFKKNRTKSVFTNQNLLEIFLLFLTCFCPCCGDRKEQVWINLKCRFTPACFFLISQKWFTYYETVTRLQGKWCTDQNGTSDLLLVTLALISSISLVRYNCSR